MMERTSPPPLTSTPHLHPSPPSKFTLPETEVNKDTVAAQVPFCKGNLASLLIEPFYQLQKRLLSNSFSVALAVLFTADVAYV